MVLAQAVCEPIIGAAPNLPKFGILGADWVSLSFLALLFSLFMLALTYIFANFWRNQQLLAWTKFELFQIFGTAVIFVFTFATVVGMCTFKMGFLSPLFYAHDAQGNIIYDDYGNPVSKNMYEIAEDYFDSLVLVGQELFAYMMYIVKIINFLTRVQWISSPIGLGMVDNPLEGIGQLNSVFFYLVSGFATSYLLLHFQMRILDYMAVASLYYLFPFGIFFRCFEPTRNFGGTLIGLSIAFFLFYPMTIAFNYYLIWDPFYNPQHGMVKGSHGLEKNLEEANQNVEDAGGTLVDLNELKDSGLQQVGSREGSQEFSAGISTGVIFLLKPVMLYFMAAVVLPIINFIVLVEITRGLTRFLGEEIDVSNLTRLI